LSPRTSAPSGGAKANKQPCPGLAVGPALAWSAGLLAMVLCDGWAVVDVTAAGEAPVGTGDDEATVVCAGVSGATVVGTGATGTAVDGSGAGTDETCELWEICEACELCPLIPDTWDEWLTCEPTPAGA
jgi:hypothetical protein